MNKLFATFTLLISTLCLAQAQDGYIKYHTDSEYRDKTVKVFKGEIVPFLNSSKSKKINVIIGFDTITDLPNTSKSYETVPTVSNTYYSQKEDYLQSKKGGFVWVNATTIPNTDTVTLISERGKQLTQLIEKREAQVNQADLGKSCRLLFSNSPSIFYSSDKLKQFVEPEPVQTLENTEYQSDEKRESGWAWWYYVLIILGAVGIGIGAWNFIQGRRNKSDEFVYFNGGSLTDFAKPYGGLDFLSSINPKGLVPTKSEWDKIKNKGEQNNKIQNLKGKKIRVKQEIKSEFGFGNVNTKNEEQENTYHLDSAQETFSQPTNLGNNYEFSGQLRQMKDEIIREIQLGWSGSNNQNEINRLRNEKTEIENKLRNLETDKRNVDAKLMQMQSDKSKFESDLQTAMSETERVQNEIKELKERVIAVDFLKGYSESVFSYLKYCQQVSSDAYNFFNKISQQNPEQAFAEGHLLMKFQSAINAIPVGDWLRTVQDIKDSGATTNRQLIRSFSQIQNDGDKQREFQRLLFSEVLTKYSSNILILAEAFKNLSRFQGLADFATEAQSTFGKHVTEIVNKAKSTGLEIKHVTLFESWEKYLGQVEDNGGERSLAYKEIGGLEKGAIAEIVSFGVKTPLGDDTKTIIILA